MRILIRNILKCPNTGSTIFQFFGSTVERDNKFLEGVGHESLLDTDEIVDGVVSTLNGYHYPIRQGVLSMLSDASVDLEAWKGHFEAIKVNCPDELRMAIDANLERLTKITTDSDGQWNREEMGYYDAAVATEEERTSMLQAIKNKFMGRTFYTRKKIILDEMSKTINGKLVLEIGCGTSRSIYRLLPPAEHGFRYVGLDISFYRLVVAKRLIPEGEFVQASALELPFQDAVADIGLAFGSIHHLPRPIEALIHLDRVLKDTSCFGLHEPIQTPKLIEGRLPYLEKLLTTYEHSDHDGEIDVEELTAFLSSHGYSNKRLHYSITPFRTLVESCICMVSSERMLESKILANILYPLDAILVHTIGNISRLLGPRALTMLAERENRPMISQLDSIHAHKVTAS